MQKFKTIYGQFGANQGNLVIRLSKLLTAINLGVWRNGRRYGLKIR